MERTIDIILDDLRNSIFGTLNNSGLPLSIIAMVMKDINNDVQLQAKVALDASKQSYINAMQQQNVVNEGVNENNIEKEE